MGEFFEKWGQKIGDTVEDLGKKAEDTMEVQKIKSQINTLKRTTERDYIDMGKILYEKYLKGEVIDAECLSFCEDIEEREAEIKDCENEISRIKGE